MATTYNPTDYISYGPNANCTLAVCPLDASVLGYLPAPAASGIFIALFALSMIIHAVQGIIWRQTLTSFAIPIIIGCIDEIIGYIGRVMLHSNPFDFTGFIIQIGTSLPLVFLLSPSLLSCLLTPPLQSASPLPPSSSVPPSM